MRRLKLTNWRNYEDVSIDLSEGTTFVVASNGVGKTSLVEAARWALFGTSSASSASPVRVGADHATATVELVLPTGSTLTVERTMNAKPARKPALPAIHLGGKRIDVDAFEVALRDAYGTEPAFLAKLTMPAASREQDTPTALGLESHLGRYFGVEALQRAGDLLTRELKNTEKEIQQVKAANASTAQQLAELETAVATAAAAVADATRDHDTAQASHEILRTELRAQQLHDAWAARHGQWLSQTNDLLDGIARELGEPMDRVSVEARLAAQVDTLSQVIENARIQIAIRESRARTITTHQVGLDDSHGDCPVCRRPLDDTTIALAHQVNEAELDALATETAALRSEEESATARRAQMQTLIHRWRSIPDPGVEPAVTMESTPHSTDIAEAARRVSEALERLVRARADQLDAERRLLEAREADDAMRRLLGLFRDAAKIQVALKTTRATLDELLERTVRPLANEVDQRWEAMFPNRGELSTRADGSITRNVNGHPLPYDSFSTGESMVVTIILRLLVAQMATSADFCWFDEPLEHLDPDVRRQVANILAGASDGSGQLRQIIVTTYEEPLARLLHARSPERVHLIDVRQTPSKSQRINLTGLRT